MEILLLCVAIVALVLHSIGEAVRTSRLFKSMESRHAAERDQALKVQKDLINRLSSRDLATYMSLRAADAPPVQQRPRPMTDEEEVAISEQFERAEF